MMPSDLVQCIEKSISEGKKPFFVSATSGTTVLGAFDPLEQLADICQKYGIWLHVDVSIDKLYGNFIFSCLTASTKFKCTVSYIRYMEYSCMLI